MREFTCEACGGTFTSELTDEQAMAESRKIFGEHIEKDKCAIICDDCYKKMTSERSPVSAEAIEVSQRYAVAFVKSEKLNLDYADLPPDERMMTFIFSVIRDKIKIGRAAEGMPENQPLPGHFYLLVLQNMMELIPQVLMAFQMMDRMSPAALQFVLEGRDPNVEKMPE